jgi:serine/threonine-protein kinase
VFALGAIVYEMLSGKPAFQGASLAEVVFKVVYEPVAPLSTVVPGIDPAISAAVERAMAKAPADRFPDVSAFIAALTGRSLATTGRGSVATGSGVSVPPTAGRITRGADTTTPGEPALSHLRGEIHARTEQSPPPVSAGGGRTALFLLIALAFSGTGIYGAFRILRTPKPGAAEATPKAETPKVEAVPKVETPNVEAVPKAETPKAEAKTDAPKTDAPKADEPKNGESGSKKVEHEVGKKAVAVAVEPPEVKAMLDEAEAALRGGDSSKAQLIADRSLRVQKTSRAYAIMTRAHCGAGDLGNAKATYQHVSAGDRPRVRKDCKSHDIDLN